MVRDLCWLGYNLSNMLKRRSEAQSACGIRSGPSPQRLSSSGGGFSDARSSNKVKP